MLDSKSFKSKNKCEFPYNVEVFVISSDQSRAQDGWRSGSRPDNVGLHKPPQADRLPPDIDFLDRAGFPVTYLRAAVLEANRLSIAPHEVVLGAGSVVEEIYYRSLAHRLHLPFIDVRDVELGQEAFSAERMHIPLRARILPFAQAGQRFYALMPRGEEVTALLSKANTGLLPERLAIATPTAARDAMVAQAPSTVLDQHVDDLKAKRADLSASTTRQRLQRLARGALFGALAVIVLVYFGLLGTATLTTGIALVLAGIFGIGLGLRCAILLNSEDNKKLPPLSDNRLPFYSILVPLYREAEIVKQLLKGLSEIDYPPALLEILLLVEADDEVTLAALRESDPYGRCALLVVPEGEPRTKPRALQWGLHFARGELITIFDAEDIPAPDQLRRAAERLVSGGERLACVQAPLAIDNPNASWFSRQFALEYAALFRLVIPGLARLRVPVMLGGTSNHFRSKALRDVFGWDPWNVTEDADLGIRLARFGYQIGAIDSQTEEEAPAQFGGWFAQRRRWLKGWMQTALVHLSRPLQTAKDLGWRSMMGLTATLVATLFASLIYPFSWIGMLLLLANHVLVLWEADPALTLAALAFFAAGHVLPLLLIAAGAQRSNLKLKLGDTLTLPAYWSLVSLAAWAALIELAHRPFHWSKTQHFGRHFSAVRGSKRAERRPRRQNRVTPSSQQ